MKENDELWEICLEIYREMYQEASPHADFDQLDKTKTDWFMKFYLSEEKQIEIVERILEKHKCRKYDRDSIRNEVYLGCAPNGHRRKKK